MEIDNDLVELGYLEESESWRLDSYLFPSKVGGKPSWLSLDNLPTAEKLQCKKCGNTMMFLCQLYAPFEENANVTPEQLQNNFHRTLFVFVCRNGHCCDRNCSENIKVFRNSLKRDNKFYSFDPPSENRPNLNFSVMKWTNLCNLCGCLADKKCTNCKNVYYCSKEHQIFDWKETHKLECGIENKRTKSKILFSEGEIVIESESVASSVASDQHELKKYEKLAQKSKTGTMANISDEDLEAYANQETDKVFQKFQKRVKCNPEQIIRYKRGGKPLWIASEPLPENIPKCQYCNSPRQFEFQIMPQMLTLLKEIDLDWGVIAVYTCMQSCTDTDGYKEEFAFKQDVEISDVRSLK